MVSLNTIITIGGLGAAYLLYKNAGGASGLGQSLGSALGNFSTGVTQSFNKFGNLVGTPENNLPEGYRLDPKETRDYEEYVNYEDQSNPQAQPDKTYGETGDGGPAFIFPPLIEGDSPPPRDNFMDQFTFTDRTTTPPPAITYGAPLPPFAGTLEYVVQNMASDPTSTRTATPEEKNYLQSFGIGVPRSTRYS
jgi:hypothetical protein